VEVIKGSLTLTLVVRVPSASAVQSEVRHVLITRHTHCPSSGR